MSNPAWYPGATEWQDAVVRFRGREWRVTGGDFSQTGKWLFLEATDGTDHTDNALSSDVERVQLDDYDHDEAEDLAEERREARGWDHA